ncbi:AraC family transcriptional regulator [Gallaecimonas pentaromativorans]|uniref:AraC family transcriptional regulator n=1 Tax=Gallaecimonas pentaromativorans TaxID=584787 RepID=UPI003A8EFFE3
MDNLSHLVQLLAPQCSVDLHCRFAGQWQADHPQLVLGVIPYHLILRGSAVLELDGKRLTLSSGDIVLLPRASAHQLKSLTTQGQMAPLLTRQSGALTALERQGDGPLLEMLCGEFKIGRHGALLFGQPPPWLHIATQQRDDCQELGALVRMMARESQANAPGGAAIVTELSAALFTLVLRALLAEQHTEPGWLKLMANSRIAGAISAVLAEPQAPWTLQTMAERCHLSRASFARHFAASYHLTPQQWLTQVRMTLAARLLLEQPHGIGLIAEQCGYLSQAAFSRAFKEVHGQPPGQYRRPPAG